MASILTRIYDWAERQPDKRLYMFLDIHGREVDSYSYAQFVRRSADVAAHIGASYPMRPGDRVLLAYPPGLEMISAFFACVRLGVVPVPVYPPTGHGFRSALAKTDFIARDCGASAVLTERSYYWSMRVNEARAAVSTLSLRRSHVARLPWIVTNDAPRGAGANFVDGHSDVLFLQYTSGSTTEPKGVIVSHDNILANCDAIADHDPVGVSWLPQYHDMGLIGYYLFFALEGGTTYGFSPLDFIRRPALWFETITKYRGTASSAPNFAYAYCLRPDKVPESALDGFDLSSLQFLMTAAEPVRAGTCRDFLQRFERCGLNPRSFFSAYGLAEFTLAVSNYGRTALTLERSALNRDRIVPAGAETPDTATLFSCGRLLGDTEVRIVDVRAEPRAADDGMVGEIWIRGASKAQGYWQRPELSAAVFGARLDDEAADAPAWLRSGDLGFMHEGELYLSGRLKDMVIVRGLNYYPQDIEVLVEQDACVRRGCVAAFGHECDGRETLVVVAELKDAKRVPDVRALNKRLVEGLGVGASTFVFLRARTIPKTSSGKIMRHVVRDRWLGAGGALVVVAQVDVEADVASAGATGTRAWLAEFGLTGDEDFSLAEAGFDSLRLVEFAESLKRALEQQGDVGLAAAVDLRVIQRIAICELVDLVDQVMSSSPHARLRLERTLRELGREHRVREADAMRRDARLQFEASTLPDRAARSPNGSPSPAAVLLTGGTGFFGPFLLASLLEQHSGEIRVLMRSQGDDAMARIRDGLISISPDGTCPPGWERRVRPVSGDLSQPGLGLDRSTWRRLAEEVHTIYHNGAIVNYLLDYHAMRDANVGGTNEVVRLALSHRPKVLNHVSTTFIFGWSVQETLPESDTNHGMERLDFGYSQSKWVAEQVVFDAMRQGLQGRVFRPALLTPSLHGCGYNYDIAVRLLSFMINHAISTTAANQVSFVPADQAAANIVAISSLPESVGATFHVTRDEYESMPDITAILGELTGHEFTSYSLRDFVPQVIGRCHQGDILFPLLDFLVRSVDNITAMEFKRYDNSNYRRFRDQSPHARRDPPLRDVVHGLLQFMRKQGVVGKRALVST
jgi:thioester reductase-like protein